MTSKINGDVSVGFDTALVEFAKREPRITIWDNPSPQNQLSRIFVDGGRTHAYVAWAAFGEEPSRPAEEWRGNVCVRYSTEEIEQELIDLRNLPYDVFKSGEAQALIAINAVKAHMAHGFIQPNVNNNLLAFF